MSGSLRCYSFHSVKGGVGKSTLSTFLAHGLACRDPNTEVVLIDLDLTGTSLSDVLPLQAPRWAGDTIDLRSPPTGEFHDRAETLRRIAARQPSETGGLQVAFLNDYLLWTDPDWSTERDVVPSALRWKMSGAPPNLTVIPSSALPADLDRIIPVIFDEEHAAFLEARLEVLLDALVPDEGERIVVIDTPPTIPGLSRSVLSLGLRLGHTPKRALADDEYIPARLSAGSVRWQIGMVLSVDWQDLRASERWMALFGPEDQDILRIILNRAPSGGVDQLRGELFGGVIGLDGGGVAPKLPTLSNFGVDEFVFLPEDSHLQFFQRDGASPPRLEDILDMLLGPRK
jgi:hypothetical protein